MNTELQFLLTITVTIGSFLAAEQIYIFFNRSPLIHPVLLAILPIIAMIKYFGWTYAEYKSDASLILFFLGPATVALAIPLYEQQTLIRKMAVPILIACSVGALVAATSAALFSWWFTSDEVLSLSMVGKSITTPIAMDVSKVIGGSPSLTAGIVVITAAVSGFLVPLILKLFKVTDDVSYGLILGLTAHGFGTAQGFERSATCGAFAGLAMSLTGVISAFILPITPWQLLLL